MKRIKDILEKMITANDGGISSKIVIGSITYLIITLAIVSVMFVNPLFPGLTEMVITNLLTSGSLLGLTVVENLKTRKKDKLSPEEDNSN